MKADGSIPLAARPWRVLQWPLAAVKAVFVWDRRDIGDRQTHIIYLVIFAVTLVAPVFLSFDPAQGDHVTLGSVELPGTCLSNRLFHVSCPGCNLTRSFVLITHGQFREAVRQHRIGIALYSFFLGQVGFRIYCLRRGRRPVPWRLLSANHYLAVATIVLLLGNWAVGLFIGGNGS